MMFCEMMLRQEKKNVFDLNSRQLTTLRVNKMMKILLFQGKNVEQNDDVDDGGGVVGVSQLIQTIFMINFFLPILFYARFHNNLSLILFHQMIK
jgi:hypothetical protein